MWEGLAAAPPTSGEAKVGPQGQVFCRAVGWEAALRLGVKSWGVFGKCLLCPPSKSLDPMVLE